MTRIAMRVEIDLDAMPGAMHQSSDWLRILRDTRNGPFPDYYHPTVELITPEHECELAFPRSECRICAQPMRDEWSDVATEVA